MKRSDLAFKRYVSAYHQNIVLLFFAFTLIALILNGCWTKKITEFYSLELSRADIVHFAFDMRFFPVSIGLFFSITIGSLLKHDFNAMIIIQYKTKRTLFFDQVKKLALFALISDLFIIAVIVLVGAMLTNVSVNFESMNSIFQANNILDLAIENPNFIFMIFTAFLMMFFSLFVVSLIIILSKWVIDNIIGGVILIIAMIAVDFQADFIVFKGIFFARNWPVYWKWADIPAMYLDLLFSLGWIVLILTAGLFVVKRREFLGTQQKQQH